MTDNNTKSDIQAADTPHANGAPVDAEAVVTVLTDYSAAFMNIYPPHNGGRDITYEQAVAALRAKSVNYNIQEELVRAAVESRIYDKEFKVAAADMPANGIDGTVTYLYSRENLLAPVEDEQGFVDYRNLGHIRNIHENEIIANITMPTNGTDGKDIRGVVMKAIPGKKASFNIGVGTRVSEDGLSIRAAVDGNICFRDNAFCVDTTVTIKGDVDASIGNLDFIGDIVVTGEVLEGFRVISGKSVTVSGNVTGAYIQAGENITIKKGAINAELSAGGDINCRFCEYSKMRAGGLMKSQDFVICDVYCQNLSGKDLSGGKYTILGDIEITHIGTKNYAPTEVIVGDNAVLNQEKTALQKQISENNSKIDRCAQIVDFLTEKRKELKRLPEDKEELLGSMVKTKLTCQLENKQAQKRIAEINVSLSQKQYRSITCKGMVYPGARITINSASMKFENETARVKIYLNEAGELATAPA